MKQAQLTWNKMSKSKWGGSMATWLERQIWNHGLPPASSDAWLSYVYLNICLWLSAYIGPEKPARGETNYVYRLYKYTYTNHAIVG